MSSPIEMSQYNAHLEAALHNAPESQNHIQAANQLTDDEQLQLNTGECLSIMPSQKAAPAREPEPATAANQLTDDEQLQSNRNVPS